MPWKPTDLSREDQIRQFYAQRPDLAAALSDKNTREELARRMREAGIDVQGYDLTNPAILAELGKIDDPELEKIFPFTQDSIADRKRAYYDRNPDQDPQSNTSRVLEFFGLDEPYYNDSRSYDYSQKKFQNNGNPDMSWFLEPTEAQTQVMEGSMPSIFGQEDDRTTADRVQGSAMGLLNFPFYGAEDEALAGMAAGAGGDYGSELEHARDVKNRHDLHTPIWSRIPEIAGSVLLSIPGFAAKQALGGAGLAAGRRAAGMTPKATGGMGQAVEGALPASGAAAAEFSAYQLGEADGDFSQRVEQYNPYDTAMFAAFPLAFGAPQFLRGAVAEGVEGGKQLYRRYFGKKKALKKSGGKSRSPVSLPALTETAPSPQRPRPARPPLDTAPTRPMRPSLDFPRVPKDGPETVRGDLERALRESGRRR